MKKTKILAVILMTLIILFSFSIKVFGTEPGDNTRQTGEPVEEPVVTSENRETPIQSEENNEETNDQIDDGHNHTEIDPSTIHQGDLYIASDKTVYNMDQLVNGNLFIVGDKIRITGEVNGSVFAFAQEIIFEEEAYIAGQVFVAGYDITINGVMVDLYSASQTLKIGENAMVYRDIKSVAENVSLSGAIGRDVKITTNRLTIPETEIPLNIYGNLEYEAGTEIEDINNKANIDGEVKYTKYVEKQLDIGEEILDLILGAIGTIVFDIVMYLALLFLAPKFVEKAKDYVSTKGLLALAIGLAFTIIIPFIILLLLMIGVGSGLSVMLMFVYFAVLMVNAFMVTLVTNEYIANKLKFSNNKLKKALLLIPVSLVIWALRKLPFIGGLISILVFLCGVGIVIFYQFERAMKNEKV